ncbi:MAG: energy-coupling factor transporter transmembrane component T, partial [Acidimicrobiia bacterium]
AYVVSARRSSAAWAASFSTFLKLGVAVLAFRVVVQVIFGFRVPGHVVVDLPALRLPEWAAGVVVGGPVTVESLALALYEGLRLLAVLACFGAANALSSPYRLLRSLPNVLYEAGVVVTVALSFAPELVITAKRIRAARRLRGRPTSGLAGLRGFLVPVLEGALERSLHLAASMDARGFGRRPEAAGGARSSAATALGILAIAGGLYGLLDTTAPPLLGLPLLALGSVGLMAGVAASGRRANRTRYRPDRWRAAETVVAASGIAALGGLVLTALIEPAALRPGVFPLQVPDPAPIALAGVLIALVPAVVAPRGESA